MRIIFILVLILSFTDCISQPGQIAIDRVEAMPSMPSPFMMRDWKDVSMQYDALIFNMNLAGTHLPLVSLKPAGVNYPEIQPIQMDTYVGTPSTTQAEAINIIPSIVGASLVGIDKSNHNGINWVEKIRDFYNSANGQNVYLNGTNSSSGNDWWYDVMPNIFFYQVYDLYPDTPDFEEQFMSVARQWLKAVQTMGGKTTPWTVPSMNYRGWNLSTMTGNASDVKEPEAAGAIGWLLYHAYVKSGEKEFLHGAELCMDFLLSLESNPSYELMLPYGIQAAAKMNATVRTNYDLKKMIDWSFTRGELRGWGTIVGKWDGKDVSGLVGEANDNGNDYAFLMNGFQQAAALVPVAKYDKRYARAIGKWVLNLANASRFFYPQFLAADRQDDFAWSNQYDPQSAIGYEALKQNWEGKLLYGTGDAKRNGWAATNLALYGSSHVGYLGAIVEQTDVEMILRLDLNKTDFFNDDTFANYLYYNPYPASQVVTVPLGANTFDIYDAISETFIAEDVSGNFLMTIDPDEVRLITCLPAATATSVAGNTFLADGHVIDYHYGNNFEPSFRIRSLSAQNNVVEFNTQITFYAEVDNPPSAVLYKWFADDMLQAETQVAQYTWTSSSVTAEVEIKVEASSAGQILKDSLTVSVVDEIPVPPVIESLVSDKKWYLQGESVKVIADVLDAGTKYFTYEWVVPAGNFIQNDSLIEWTAPSEGLYLIHCVVTNVHGQSGEKVISILVKSETNETSLPIAYYPMNVDVKDHSGNEHHALVEGTFQADDPLGITDFAYEFSSGSDIIYVNNAPTLNFRDAITVSFWISPASVEHEAFILSHGSWEERWKASITPGKKLRWTVKTEGNVIDLDSSEPLTPGAFVHVALVYSGYSMELYLNGELDSYVAQNGLMRTTLKPVTFGQKSYGERQYYYAGVLDEVRIYDKGLQPDEISELQNLWQDEITGVSPEIKNIVYAFPNPSRDRALILDAKGNNIQRIVLIAPDGKILNVPYKTVENRLVLTTTDFAPGINILRITTASEVIHLKVIFL